MRDYEDRLASEFFVNIFTRNLMSHVVLDASLKAIVTDMGLDRGECVS